MRKKAYGLRVAGQTNQGSARLAILGRDYVATKRNVNRDVDRVTSKSNLEMMRAALAHFGKDEIEALATKGEYKKSPGQTKKATAMPMNFWRGSGFGG